MNSKILIVAIVVVAIVAVSVFLFVNKSNLVNKSGTTDKTTSGQSPNGSNPQTNTQASMIEVGLTSAGFEPNEIKIKTGTTVVWANKSGEEATVSSDPHPTHRFY